MTIDNWGLTEYNDYDLCAIRVGRIGNTGFEVHVDNDGDNNACIKLEVNSVVRTDLG